MSFPQQNCQLAIETNYDDIAAFEVSGIVVFAIFFPLLRCSTVSLSFSFLLTTVRYCALWYLSHFSRCCGAGHSLFPSQSFSCYKIPFCAFLFQDEQNSATCDHREFAMAFCAT